MTPEEEYLELLTNLDKERFLMRRALQRVDLEIALGVSKAQLAGASWRKIGRALGVSGQAAWSRYGLTEPR
jgi:hypothetical protein